MKDQRLLNMTSDLVFVVFLLSSPPKKLPLYLAIFQEIITLKLELMVSPLGFYLRLPSIHI
jgi:hypothetical protein